MADNQEKTYTNIPSRDQELVDDLVANHDWNSDGNNEDEEEDWEIPDIAPENGGAGDKENLQLAENNSTPINVEERFKEIDANAMAAKNAEEEKNQLMEKQDLILKRKKRVKYSPPGLKIFKSQSSEIFFHFSRKDLNIVKDFNFQRKEEIIHKFGVEEKRMDEMLHTPWKLIVYISAETNTPLIQNEQDFGNILFLNFLKNGILH